MLELKALLVTGCSDCPCYHNEVGEGEWCGADDNVSFATPVRDKLSPHSPAFPDSCPLKNGVLTLALAS